MPNSIIKQCLEQRELGEQIMLGAMLLDLEEALVGFELIHPRFFTDMRHFWIYHAILDVVSTAVPVDLITVGEWLKRRGILEKCGGATYLAELMTNVPSELLPVWQPKDPFVSRLIVLRGMPYCEYLQTPEWQETRKRALSRAGYTCQMCRAKNVKLNVHHNTYERRGCERDDDLVVLCETCHAKHEDKLPVLPDVARAVSGIGKEQP